jgi:hypothetical protein
MLKVDPLLRHIYDMVSHQSQVLHELEGLLVGTCHCKVVTRCIQVNSGV